MRYDKVNRLTYKTVLLFLSIPRDSFFFFFFSEIVFCPPGSGGQRASTWPVSDFERDPEALRYDEQAQD